MSSFHRNRFALGNIPQPNGNISQPSSKQITFVNSATSGDGSASASNVISPPTSLSEGNLLIVCVRQSNSSTITGITDSAGNIFTQVGVVSSSTDRLSLWFSKNTISHANNVVTANFSPASTYRYISIFQYSGIDKISPLDVSAIGTSSSGTIVSASYTTTQADELIFIASQVAFLNSIWTALPGHTKRIDSYETVSSCQDIVVSTIQTAVKAVALNSDTTSPKSILVATFKKQL